MSGGELTGPGSAIVGHVDLAPEPLARALATIDGFVFSDVYSDFTVGAWDSCMLWNATGRAQDALLTETRARSQQTELGAQLPYINEVISAAFAAERLKFARLMRIKQDSLVLPHVDFLEFSEPNTRLHVPLQTDEDCYYAEEAELLQMRTGEIWYLDVSRVHSAASFSPRPRINLVLDFEYTARPWELVRDGFAFAAPREPRRVPRQPLSEDAEDAVLGLAQLIRRDSLGEVVGLLAKLQYRVDVRADEMYRWLGEIARRSGDAEVVELVSALTAGCLHARRIGESPFEAARETATAGGG